LAKEKIIFIQTAFLGDLLLSVPALKNLRQQFKDCEVTLVCRQGVGQLFKDLKLVENVYEIKKGNRRSYQEVLDQLAAINFDYLISPHESFTTAKFSGKIKAHTKIAFKKWWNFIFFNERIEKDQTLPEALRQISLLQNHIPDLKAKLMAYKAENRFYVPEWASAKISLPDSGKQMRSICLFPGSVWATKKWTEEGFIQVGKDFFSRGYDILVMGGPGEEEIAERVKSGISNSSSKVQNLAGKTSLMESLQLIHLSSLVVTNDSAGQHMAALTETPTVSIFGPTIPEFGYRGWNNQSVVVETKDLACRPCGKHGHQACPIGTHICMKSISGENVSKAADKLLKS
jgi:heptosyltransferase-2